MTFVCLRMAPNARCQVVLMPDGEIEGQHRWLEASLLQSSPGLLPCSVAGGVLSATASATAPASAPPPSQCEKVMEERGERERERGMERGMECDARTRSMHRHGTMVEGCGAEQVMDGTSRGHRSQSASHGLACGASGKGGGGLDGQQVLVVDSCGVIDYQGVITKVYQQVHGEIHVRDLLPLALRRWRVSCVAT